MATPLLRVLPGLLLAGCLLAGAAHGAAIHGVVSHVTDGDTIWVRPDGGGAPIEIRLLGIDAPEGCQRFGPEAKRALARRLLKQRVVLRTHGVDDYQRTLASVQQGREDVGAWLVREGYAWSSGLRHRPGRYAALEEQARRERRGLWAGEEATEPRSFRRSHGRCQ